MPDACVSMVVLSDLDKLDPNVQILLSGYRSGLLLATKIEITDEGSFVSRELFRGIVGMTPVALKSDTTCESAIICCDSKVFRFQYDKTQISSVSLRRIWFTDAARVSTVIRFCENNVETNPGCSRLSTSHSLIMLQRFRMAFCLLRGSSSLSVGLERKSKTSLEAFLSMARRRGWPTLLN